MSTDPERFALIHKAAGLPKGDPTRRKILAKLAGKTAERTAADMEPVFRQEHQRRREGADQALGYLVKAQRILAPLPGWGDNRALTQLINNLRRKLR